MKINKKIIVWNVTSKCNLNCGFCFGPEKGVEDFNPSSSFGTSVDKVKQQGFEMINKFKREGAEKLVFTGGEPLTRKDLVDLIKYSKEKGLYTIVHTNGLLLSLNKLKELSEYLDQINLSIDGCDEGTNKLMREQGVFEQVMVVLKWLKEYPDLKIVISTVVTKVNKNCIIKIAEILPEYIYKWRVFQFKAVGKAELFKEKYEISDGEFEKIMADVKRMDLNFDVQFVEKDDEFYKSYAAF